MTEPTNEINWTTEDSVAANEQGWGIFETSRCETTEAEIVNGKPYGHRPFELQSVDEAAIFNDDDAAHVFVREAAEKGDSLALHALAYLQQVSTLEYEAIMAV